MHGLSADTPITFRAESGGTLPGGLSAGTTYYAIPVSESRFQVAAAEGGAAIDLTTAGQWFLVVVPLPIAGAIEYGAALIDQSLPAHALPLVAPYPPIVRMTNAELAAHKLGYGSTSKTLTEIMDAATKRLEKWAKGIPLRGENTESQEPSNLATAAATTAPYNDSRGWGRFGGTGGGCC